MALEWVLFRSSSVVEQPAVNRRVVGSNPTCGANISRCPSSFTSSAIMKDDTT